jgi:hypothetical protein
MWHERPPRCLRSRPGRLKRPGPAGLAALADEILSARPTFCPLLAEQIPDIRPRMTFLTIRAAKRKARKSGSGKIMAPQRSPKKPELYFFATFRNGWNYASYTISTRGDRRFAHSKPPDPHLNRRKSRADEFLDHTGCWSTKKGKRLALGLSRTVYHLANACHTVACGRRRVADREDPVHVATRFIPSCGAGGGRGTGRARQAPGRWARG